MTEIIAFDKYDTSGAYHWIECDRRFVNWKRYNPALDARYQVIVRAVNNLGLRGRLLDVGCGDGLLMARLARIMAGVIGVDSEITAIRLAEEKLREFSNCDVMHITGRNLPFDEETFDVITLADVVEHLTRPEDLLKEIRRVLRPAGALVVTTPKWRPDRKWDVRHEKEYRPDELRALLSPYFNDIVLSFFWPLKWSRFYATTLGWRLLKLFTIWLHNPFLGSSSDPEKFGQILAVCRLRREKTLVPAGRWETTSAS